MWTLVRDDRRPDRYLIPDGFVGWVRIDYEVEGAPELPIEDGFYLLRIPASGHLETSSSLGTGWASDEYYYLSARGDRDKIRATARGRGGLIWRGIVGGLEKPGYEGLIFQQFFVGPEVLAEQQSSRAPDGQPHHGPVSPTPNGERPNDVPLS